MEIKKNSTSFGRGLKPETLLKQPWLLPLIRPLVTLDHNSSLVVITHSNFGCRRIWLHIGMPLSVVKWVPQIYICQCFPFCQSMVIKVWVLTHQGFWDLRKKKQKCYLSPCKRNCIITIWEMKKETLHPALRFRQRNKGDAGMRVLKKGDIS